MSFFQPSNANQLSVEYGVNDTMSNYIIQNEDKGENIQNLEIQDQWGRTCYVIAYNKGKTITLTMIGSATQPFSVGDQIKITAGAITNVSSGGDYLVTSVNRTCTYNDTAKWQIQGTGFLSATYVDKTSGNFSPIQP